MTHITTDHDEAPIIRLAFNLGVEDIHLLSGAEMTSPYVYIVFLNGEFLFKFGICEHHREKNCLSRLQKFQASSALFSSPEPSGSQGELIVYPCSVVRPSVVRHPPFSKIFSSETAWPIKAKFYMKHLWEGGTSVYINNPGHMTKMAAMPIYGKNPSKIFFSGTTGPISIKLGMKH